MYVLPSASLHSFEPVSSLCSENGTSERRQCFLSLFYVFIYAVLHLSFFEKNNKMCVCFSAAGGGED